MAGDVEIAVFREQAHRLVDWIARYLSEVERYPVVARVGPGELRAALPRSAPVEPEPLSRILDDVERLIVPALTHWNHPGFFAYFANSSTGPAILGELLAAAVNANAMLWKTSPAATELELGGQPADLEKFGDLFFVGGAKGRSDEELKERARQLSPARLVTRPAIPFLLIHGDADSLVPLQQSEKMVEVLKSAGGSAKLIVKKGGGHPWLTIPEEVKAMANWFDQQLPDKKASPAPASN